MLHENALLDPFDAFVCGADAGVGYLGGGCWVLGAVWAVGVDLRGVECGDADENSAGDLCLVLGMEIVCMRPEPRSRREWDDVVQRVTAGGAVVCPQSWEIVVL